MHEREVPLSLLRDAMQTLVEHVACSENFGAFLDALRLHGVGSFSLT